MGKFINSGWFDFTIVAILWAACMILLVILGGAL